MSNYRIRYDSLLAEKEELERVLEDMHQEMEEECALNGKEEDVSALRSLIHKLEVPCHELLYVGTCDMLELFVCFWGGEGLEVSSEIYGFTNRKVH